MSNKKVCGKIYKLSGESQEEKKFDITNKFEFPGFTDPNLIQNKQN